MSEEKKVILVYKGQRLGKSGKVQYVFNHTNSIEDCWFNKNVGAFGIIGTQTECSENDNSYSNFSLVGPSSEKHVKISDKLISQWSTEHRATLQEKAVLSEVKKGHDRTLENQVKTIKDSFKYLSPVKKRNVALWIYNELLK